MPNSPMLSVVIPVLDPGPRLSTMLRSIESQDLPYAGYELVVVDRGSTDGSRERLAEVASHRPNVRVVEEEDPAAWLQAGLARATGEYVLQLDVADRLMPSALPLLLDRVSTDRPDAVLGRTAGSGPIGFLPETRLRPWRADDPDAPVGLLTPVALVRRTLLNDLVGAGPVGWRTTRLRLLSTARSIVALTDPVLLIGSGPGTAESALEAWRDADVAAAELADAASTNARARFIGAHAVSTIRRFGDAVDRQTAALMTDVVRRRLGGLDLQRLPPAQRAVVDAVRRGPEVRRAVTACQPWSQIRVTPEVRSIGWVDGRLRLELTVTVSVPAGSDSLAAEVQGLSPVLLVRDVETWALFELGSTVTAPDRPRHDDRSEPWSLGLSTDIDISTAAAGGPLDNGDWELLVRLHGAGADAPIGRSVPFAPVGAAVVDGRPVRPHAEDGRLRLDVGAVGDGFLGRRDPEDASITESAAGSLLTIRLPDLAVRGDAEISGDVYLGTFPLRARLLVRQGRARIECLLSGMAGVNSMSARFGRAAREPLGLRLRIGATGDMSVERQPAAKAAAGNRPASGRRPAAAGTAARPAPANPTRAAVAAAGARSAARSAVRLLPDSLRRPATSLYRRIAR